MAVTILTLTLVAPVGQAAERYVSPSGSDADPGTIDEPWRTIQRAADTVQPGTTVFIRAGSYNERVRINVSGNAIDGPIVFRGYPGEIPLIDGTGLAAPAGDNGLVTIENRSYVTLADLEIANYRTSNAARLVVGVLVDGAGEQIRLERLDVHDIRNTAAGVGDAHAIAAYGRDGSTPVSAFTVADSVVHDCQLGTSEALVVNGNVDGFEIVRNVVRDHDNIGIVMIGWEGTAPANDQARNGRVADNRVYNITSFGNPGYGTERSAGGIYVDGGRDILIERNVVHHADLGIEVGCEHANKTASGVIVRDNILYRNNVTGLAFGGYDASVGTVLSCEIRNNTFFANDTTESETGELMIQKSHDVLARENVLMTSSQAIAYTNYFSAAQSHDNTMTFNLIYGPGGQPTHFVWQNEEYTGLDTFRSATGQESGSQAADPQFVATQSTPPDLHLAPSSAAIDAGEPNVTPPPEETDIDAEPRLAGAAVEQGADECHVPGAAIRLDLENLPVDETRLSWKPAPGTSGHDVTRGELEPLRTRGGGLGASVDACLASDAYVSEVTDPEQPPAGDGFWYLLRSRSCGGVGSYDGYGQGLVGSRDPELAAAPAACP